LTFTFKELLKKFLGGRCESLKVTLFQQVFEACPALGWSLSKPLLKCFLIKTAEGKAEGGKKAAKFDFGDDEDKNQDKDEKDGGSRSNF